MCKLETGQENSKYSIDNPTSRTNRFKLLNIQLILSNSLICLNYLPPKMLIYLLNQLKAITRHNNNNSNQHRKSNSSSIQLLCKHNNNSSSNNLNNNSSSNKS